MRLSSCRTTPILLEAMRSDAQFLSALTDITLIWKVPTSWPVPDADFVLYTHVRSATCATVKYLALEDEIILYEGPTLYTTMWEELMSGGLEVVETCEPLF